MKNLFVLSLIYANSVVLACPKTVMENKTSFPWNDFDMQTLAYAKKRCGELYPDAKCVKLFRKWDKKDYSVICGV